MHSEVGASGRDRKGPRRRAKLGRALLAALALLPCLAEAADTQPRVAVLRTSRIGPFADAIGALETALRADRRQPEILTFDLEAGGDVASAMESVRRSAPAVVVSVGSLATSLALEAAPPLDAPIVFSMVLYPAESGFLSGGRAITGASLDVPPREQLSTLQRLLPEAHSVGVLYSPRETGAVVAAAKPVAERLGLQLVSEAVDEPSKAPVVLDSLMKRVDALWTVADGGVFTPQTTPALLLAALRSRKPMLGLSPGQVRSGALAALVVDYEDVGRQTAEIVGSILGGRRAADVPITHPRHVTLALNLRTAELLGVKIPPDVLSEAHVLVQ
ncbi:ABC transporter substrate-binding protein [Candidatus Binatia bacterium]|nr:ABC transporter substrate-binding protein [Candidatus Binatia bacterium]